MSDDYPWNSVDRNTEEKWYSEAKYWIAGSLFVLGAGAGAYLGLGRNDVNLDPGDIITILEENPEAVNEGLIRLSEASNYAAELYSSAGL